MSQQRTPEWFAERAGCATASSFSDILAKVKTGEAAVRRKYRMKLLTERLTGISVQGYTNAAMQWGIETEPQAREAYEMLTGEIVEEVGFIRHPAVAWCGASPDGLVGDDGLLEIKCPESTTHLEWLDASRAPPEHVPQIQGQMWVTGRQWVDFLSFDPRFPEHLQCFLIRVLRDDAYIAMLQAEVEKFLAEVEKRYTELINRPPRLEPCAPLPIPEPVAGDQIQRKE